MIITPLAGHVSKDTAFLIPDYPYGFTLRCQKRVWIEHKPRFGERIVEQTSNPKVAGTVWNAPKASTYDEVKLLYLDEQGYVQHTALSRYSKGTEIDAIEAHWTPEMLTGQQRAFIMALRAYLARVAARDAARREAELVSA